MPRLLRRTLLLVCFAGALVPAAASAGTPAGEFTHEQAREALSDAREALAPATAPADGRDATLALRDLAVALPALNDEEARRARGILERPTDKNDREYFGPESENSPICTAEFCVHWTDKGKNAPASDQFIQDVVDATTLSYAVENVQLGWREPKSDGSRGARKGVGGEGQTDVYLTNLGRRLFGFAAPDPGQKGAKRSAYLVLDNNFVGFPSPPLESMQVTVAHEYNHILQFAYDTLEDLWFFEASATWMEQKVYPDINDYLNFLPPFAKLPQAPLTGRDKVYADAVWNHWLESRYGPDIVRQAWDRSTSVKPKHLATSAYEASIKALGGKSFSREFAAMVPVTAEWNSSTSFPDAARYPEVRRRGKLGKQPSKVKLDNTAFELTDIKSPAASVKLEVKAPTGVRSAIALVGREGPEVGGAVTIESKYLGSGGKASVTLKDAKAFERVTAVVVNADGRLGAKGYKSDGSEYSVTLTGR